ncbi:MAG: cytochrome oxidase subunit III [Bacteroidia bacterium]|jgi:cytochrome c oxidase subunit 3|nr:cytochrome oxidase subunit III [Bacteroidia bacterium]
MSNQAATVQLRKDWDGGVSPFGVSYGKLFMWFFLVSDALTFSSLLCAYGFMRHKFTGAWAKPNEVFNDFPFVSRDLPLAYVGFMTFDLIMSSVTMVLAVEAGHRKSRKEVIMWLALTVLGGLIFVGSQCWEWYHFITGSAEHQRAVDFWMNGKHIVNQHFEGANLVVNAYTALPTFGDFFFCITGFHGFHVFSGVVINIIILIMVAKGMMDKRGHYEMVEKAGLYWHFVDLVWVFVFTFFYLL